MAEDNLAATTIAHDPMAGPRLAEPQLSWENIYDEHPVNELLSNKSGSQSPFGDDLSFPLPVADLYYSHPGPENRPHRAGH